MNPSPSPLVHEIDRSIYGMPMFVTLPVSDMAASRSWYATLGFIELAVMPPDAADTQLVHLRRYRNQDILLVPATGPVEAGDGRCSFAHVGATAALHDLAAAVDAHDRGRLVGVMSTPWHTIDLVAEDPDGNTVVLTARSDEEPPEAWSDEVRASIRD